MSERVLLEPSRTGLCLEGKMLDLRIGIERWSTLDQWGRRLEEPSGERSTRLVASQSALDCEQGKMYLRNANRGYVKFYV